MAASKKVAKELVVICKYTFKHNGAFNLPSAFQPAKQSWQVEGSDQVERNGRWL